MPPYGWGWLGAVDGSSTIGSGVRIPSAPPAAALKT